MNKLNIVSIIMGLAMMIFAGPATACQVGDTVYIFASSRTMTYSDLDRNSCMYQSAQASASDQEMNDACVGVVKGSGYTGKGYLQCNGSKPMPNITIGCSGWAESFSFDQVFTARYMLTAEDCAK